jgi:hypothetical protein
MSEKPQSTLGLAATIDQSRWGSSSLLLYPPITLRTAAMPGSANAACRSATGEATDEESKSSRSSTCSP